MPASSLSIGAPSLGDDGATIDSADAFDLSLLCTGIVSPAGCGTAGDDDDGADASSSSCSASSSTNNDYGQNGATPLSPSPSSVAQHVELKMRNAELRSAHDLLEHAHRRKEEECDSLRAESAAIAEERDAAFESVRELRRVLRQFQKNATEFSMQRARMRVEVERLQEESDRMKRNYKNAAEERDGLQERYDSLVTSLKHLKTTTEQLTKERDELREKYEGKDISQKSAVIPCAKEQAITQGNQGTWIERSFRLPTNSHHQQVEEDNAQKTGVSSDGRATPDTSCSRLTCDEGQDDNKERSRRELTNKQGWFSFRWDLSKKDVTKSNDNPRCSESATNTGVAPQLDSTSGTHHQQSQRTLTEENNADSSDTQSEINSQEEIKIDEAIISDAQGHTVGEDKALKEEDQKDDGDEGNLPRANSFCLPETDTKGDSSDGFHGSWGPESSKVAPPRGKRMLQRSQSAMEGGSVRFLFGKESRHFDDGETNACMLLREGAFESAATPSSSLEDQTERRFLRLFRQEKERDREGETGEIGDADEGDCNAIIQRIASCSSRDEGCKVGASKVGRAEPNSFWGRHTKKDTSAEPSEKAILRRRSNGDLSLGSGAMIKDL